MGQEVAVNAQPHVLRDQAPWRFTCQEAGDLAVFANPSPKAMHKGGPESPSQRPVLGALACSGSR